MSGTAKRREEQRLALWDKWKNAVAHSIIGNAINISKLGGYGEEVYNNCLALMSAYRDVSAIYDGNRENIITLSVRDILEGIYSIIASRLRQFEDAENQTGGELLSEESEADSSAQSVNPVAEENRSICLNVLSRIYTAAAKEPYLESVNVCAAALNDLSARPVLQSYIDMTLGEWDVMSSIIRIQVNALEASLPFASDSEQIIVNNILTRLRESYQHFGRAVTELNDVLRGDGTLALKKAEQAAETYVPPAVKTTAEQNAGTAVESPVKSTEMRDAEQATLPTANQDAGQMTKHDAAQVAKPAVEQVIETATELSNEATTNLTVNSSNEAISNLTAEPVTKPAVQSDLKYDSSFDGALRQEAFALADDVRLSYIRAAYRFQRTFSEESHLANDIVTLFENLSKTLPSSEPLPPEAETQKAILSGVAETVEIKIESLRESISYFTESGKQLIKNFASDRKAMTDEELESFYARAINLWRLEMSDKSAEDVPAFFEQLENDELILSNKNYNEKKINEYTEKTEKALLRFKKETLLYEICTYEEILTHSVSRLRDCENETVKQAVELLDETFGALEVLLKKNNIEVIHPLPHQMFNARENEVLVAEKNGEFNKGEVIKTINSGYKQKDVIILRANVVAAR